MPGSRILLLAVDCETTRFLIPALQAAFSLERIILEEPPSRIKMLRKRARRQGWWVAVGQALFRLAVVPLLAREAAHRIAAIKNTYGLEDKGLPEALVTRVVSANSAEATRLLQETNPDAVVVNGTRILSAEVLGSVPAPFANIHAGITPLYRGAHGGYWALAQRNADACGVTVHLVDKGVDTGGILQQALIQPGPRDNFCTYPLLQYGVGIPLLVQSLSRVLAGDLTLQRSRDGASRLWSHPTLWGYVSNRLFLGVK